MTSDQAPAALHPREITPQLHATGGEATRPARRRLSVGVLAPSALALLIAVSMQTHTSMRELAVRCLLVSVIACGMTSHWDRRELLSPSSIYVCLFSLFHLGLFIIVGLAGMQSLAVRDQALYAWLESDLALGAAKLSSIGLTVFAAVATILTRSPQAIRVTSPQKRQRVTAAQGLLGALLETVGLSMWSLQIIQGGGFAAIAGGGYLRFLETAQTPLTGYGTLFLGCGLALTTLGTRRVRVYGLAIFAPFALLAFPMGLRGTVLFPLAAWLALRHLANRSTSLPLVATVTVVLMALSAMVRAFRVGGADTVGPDGFISAIVAAVAEMGGSAYTVVVAQRWQLQGDEQDHFRSFLVVPLRLWEQWFTSVPPPAGEEDMRIFNVKINALEGPYGGSPIAEGFQAWGGLGVVVAMLAIGLAIGGASRWARRSALGPGYAAALMFPFFINVRNSFAPVPTQIALMVAVVGAIGLLATGRDRDSAHSSVRGA